MLHRLLSPSRRTMRGLAVASLISQMGIVLTGGAVRLTASGLGCPTWPRCVGSSYVPTAEYGVHGAIEFGNRLLTYVLGLIALATLVAALRWRPRRRDVQGLALLLFLGIPVQALIGGITVLTRLNPWTVAGHFLVSMVLVGLATLLVRRTADGGGSTRLLVPPLLHRLALGHLVALAVVVVLGTVVTGSGPHAGDRAVPRTGLDPELMSRLHADAVFLLVGMTIAMTVALTASGAPRRARTAWALLLGMQLAQGVVGFVQYFTGLPVLVVGLHLLGAAVLVATTVRAIDVLTERRPLPAPAPRPGAVAAVPA